MRFDEYYFEAMFQIKSKYRMYTLKSNGQTHQMSIAGTGNLYDISANDLNFERVFPNMGQHSKSSNPSISLSISLRSRTL